MGQVGLSSLFPNWVEFRPLRPRLQHHSLFALEQLLSPDCKTLLSWKELQNQVLSLSSNVPQWFRKVESVLGIGRPGSCARTIVLPPSLHPAVSNPFRSSLLPFAPISARVGDFVAVFPDSFPEDGNYFLA